MNQGYIYVSIENRGVMLHAAGNAQVHHGEVGTFASEDQARAYKTWHASIRSSTCHASASTDGAVVAARRNCMFRYPEIFHTGIAIAAVADQRLYDTVYQERYMNTPQNNPEGYRKGLPYLLRRRLAGQPVADTRNG